MPQNGVKFYCSAYPFIGNPDTGIVNTQSLSRGHLISFGRTESTNLGSSWNKNKSTHMPLSMGVNDVILKKRH